MNNNGDEDTRGEWDDNTLPSNYKLGYKRGEYLKAEFESEELEDSNGKVYRTYTDAEVRELIRKDLGDDNITLSSGEIEEIIDELYK